ncbi:hypothetical protein [Fusibacter paucivorans]|nr:hypothetical protein [Fusibacter paucivorans]
MAKIEGNAETKEVSTRRSNAPCAFFMDGFALKFGAELPAYL